MSIDEIAQRAGAELRQDVLTTTEVEHGLLALEGRSRRRHRIRVAAAAVAAVAVVSVGVPATVTGWRGPREVPAPVPADRSVRSICSVNSAVTCPGPRRVRVGGPSPYELAVPDGFSVPSGQALAPGLLDVFQDGVRAGVTVVQDAIAVGVGPADKPDGARGMASWIAARPFLEATAPSRTVIGDRPAWVVDVRLAPGALPDDGDRCNWEQSQCRRLLQSGADPLDWEVGAWAGRVNRYYCVDGRGSRVTVLWSWAFEEDQEALDANDAVARGFAAIAR
jgi:hypothetical protein